MLVVVAGTPGTFAQMPADRCPVWIGIAPKGALYELSPRGLAPVKTDLTALRSRLANGCQAERLSPSRVTSVTVKVAPHTMRGNTSTVFALLAQQGWPRTRVHQMVWSNPPH
jgi:hypothetical protein